MKPLYIFNTLSRTVEEFKPLKPGAVTMYSCGPTVYLPQHLGNLRAYLFVDQLRRTLEFNGYRVRHVMNVTDVGHMTGDADQGEDKIEKTARAQNKSPLEIANQYLELFQRDCAALHIEPPQVWSRATEHIAAMQALIARIIAAGYAYVTKSGVYFDVERYRGENRVGRLSRQSLDEQQSAQRLEHSPDKHSPHDFTLWVLGQPDHLMQWDSPWGRGYPGWHIECSAMAMQYLGETIDIHTGGMDHIPIHHENEIAQSESATQKPFARYFVHNAFLVGKEGAKISKSAGKFPLLSEVAAAGIDPLAFRIFCFGAKYRSEIALSDEGLRAAQSNLDYFFEFARNVPADAAAPGIEPPGWCAEYYERFHEAINNDLNLPQAMAVALELVAEAYRRKDFEAWPALRELDAVLGLDLDARRQAAGIAAIPPDVQALIDNRAAARKARDFALADQLRKELENRGYEVKDNRDGTATYQRRRD
ncbi:MAG TPA: cysteine--tRNA ligase [Candidatus Acidoferrales bacterium]|nr:cysteine--tRNA ligase [Candidatus Acidoferrales bacterium]